MQSSDSGGSIYKHMVMTHVLQFEEENGRFLFTLPDAITRILRRFTKCLITVYMWLIGLHSVSRFSKLFPGVLVCNN